MLKCTFILNSPDYISPPVLQLQPGVFHSLIFWDVTHMQQTTIETLLIHVSFGCSKTETFQQVVFLVFLNVATAVCNGQGKLQILNLALVSFWNLTRYTSVNSSAGYSSRGLYSSTAP